MSNQPVYDRAFYDSIIAARNADATLPAAEQKYWHAADELTTPDDWFCHFCGIMQPAWAGDCLTCEHTDMMGRTD